MSVADPLRPPPPAPYPDAGLRAMQAAVAAFVRAHGLEAPVETRVLDLLSEAGEIAREVVLATGYGRQPFQAGEGWRLELGDMLFALACLANSSGVDLSAALEEVLGKMQARLEGTGTAGSRVSEARG